jgi:hypothetical protein
MKKLQPVLAASLGVLVGLAAFMSAAEARGGGGGFGGHGGGFGGGRAGGFGDRGMDRGVGDRGFGPGGGGYGPLPAGRTNPYARNAIPWVGMDYNDLLQEPANNSGSSQPNDCNYLYKRALDSGDPSVWKLFNDCSHNR